MSVRNNSFSSTTSTKSSSSKTEDDNVLQLDLQQIEDVIDIDIDDSDHSDDDKLIIETPKKKLASKRRISIPESDKQFLADIEESIENALDEKAAKANLNFNHVKHILKEVVTNKQVLAFVKHAENPENEEFTMEYEPKITRAKARELSVESPFCKWPNISNEEPSETHVLINEELPEDDSSEDEYVPVDEPLDSEDDNNSSIASEQTPNSTPIHSTDCSTQTNWTEDGAFKIPQEKSPSKSTTKATETEEANIARRTRSKVSYTDTPLEEIESRFIPPDITTDMYEMDYECDEDWKNFLKEFTRPLDEVVATHEDEDHDPEYNVLAEEEVVLKEEWRSDKAVNISRKELNLLIGELIDYADNYNNYFEHDQQEEEIITETDTGTVADFTPVLDEASIVILDPNQAVMCEDQRALFEQQMRQHVQLLAQGFLLTRHHPDLNCISEKFLNYLEDLKEVSCETSFYSNTNIKEGLDVVNEWEQTLNSDTTVAKEYKDELTKTCYEAKQAKAAGIVYIPKFPKLLLDTICNSNVFVYASFLPRVMYIEANPKVSGFVSSENELIALGLEQFIPYLQTVPYHLRRNGEVKMSDVCFYIKKYMMPNKDEYKLYKHVSAYRYSTHQNPIKLYFEKKTVWPITHYVVPLKEYYNIPPCKRNPNELPYQWREHVHPECANNNVASTSQIITKISKPPVYNKRFVKRRQTQAAPKTIKTPKQKPVEILPTAYEAFFLNDDLSASTPKCKKSLFKLATPGVKKQIHIPDALLKVKFNSSIFSKTGDKIMNMPSLTNSSNTSDTCMSEETFSTSTTTATTSTTVVTSEVVSNVNIEVIDISSSTSMETETMVDSTVVEITNCDNPSLEEKDNLDDINALVVASSTIKSAIKRRPTGPEKKRAKLKRDFADNVRLLAEEDSEVIKEKRTRFIQAFYDKVQDLLDLDDFHKFMAVLNDFDEDQSPPKVLFDKVAEIVGDKHPDVMNEFLLFFDGYQAKSFGKLVPYLMMSNMSLFLRKLEMFFQDQPSHVRKIYRAITDLSARDDVTMAQVKSTVLPLLKGNGLLTDWFLQIFPMEKPPARLLNGAWENICLSKDTDDNYETLVLPEVDDPYGGPNCICNCHSVEDDGYKVRTKHCTPCGTKFMQGRVFLQTGKGLRPAKITFDDTSVDHRVRLSASLKKRSETSPIKLVSPGKDSQDETRQSSDEEPEKKQRLLKTTKKRKPKKKAIENEHELGKNCTENQSAATEIETIMIVDDSPEKTVKNDHNKGTTDITDEIEVDLSGRVPQSITSVDVVDVTPMLMADEPQEWDCNTSMDSIEIRHSPEQCQSAESESECCEEFGETSQDNNSDSDISGNDCEQTVVASTSTSTIDPWTREEDKVILETFQKEEIIDTAFKRILEQLENRTLDQVKDRFDVLINFLKKMRETP